jgi:hypothetical protein
MNPSTLFLLARLALRGRSTHFISWNLRYRLPPAETVAVVRAAEVGTLGQEH